MIGTTFSGYSIQEKIGGGNTGIVYKAYDAVNQRHLAIKILPNNFLISKEKIARFNRETQAARLLSHQAIARMLEVGTDQGHNFIAMEYVDGRSYTQIIEDNHEGIPLDQFFSLMLPILDGVGYAHQNNMVHRDLKPENLKVTSSGQPKVLDFGLVKFLDKEPSSEDSFQTLAGMVVGSAGYMSPEQAEGLTFDERTDVFSLGIIMYELLTGKNPFQSNSPFATITKIISQDPLSIELLRPDIPLPLCRVIFQCLFKDMTKRLSDATSVYDAIAAAQG